jgi:hypothetical protein
LAFTVPAHAQTEARVLVGTLNTTEFPKISTYIDVRGSQGVFISTLPNTAATVFEDNEPIPANIVEMRPGAQIVVAYGGGESFGIATLKIQTRHTIITSWILQWAATQQGNQGDNLSLIVPDGVLVSHETDPVVFQESLLNYTPDFNQAPTPLEVLSAAIDTALEPLPAEGMGRTVLFLTQGVPEEQQAILQDLANRAAQAGVRVNIGFVNSESQFSGNQAINLQAAAKQTGGQYFTFSNQEPLPDLDLMFESSRRTYFLEYFSAANTTGEHTVQVMINTDQAEIVSNTVTFTADIAPPQPILVAPPNQIVRAVPEGMANSIENLAPTSQTFAVLTEFPDGIPRQISRLALYINDELVAETTEPPFDSITFDLNGYQETENISIRIEVTDELGLTGSSESTPVEVLVQVPETGIFSLFGRNATLIIGGVIGISGAVLFLVLVLAGRLRPRRLGERWEKRKATRDPVTQPIDQKKLTQATPEEKESVIERITHRLPEAPRITWPARSSASANAYGHLVRISEDGESQTETFYPITTAELTFGSDPKQTAITLDDPAIAPVHARLIRDEEGSFFIEDTGSTAGTWLNYAQVSDQKQPVFHGDLIHIASIGYRIILNKPKQIRETVITQLKTPTDNSQKEN